MLGECEEGNIGDGLGDGDVAGLIGPCPCCAWP
jgi:hypothetical protein